MKFSLCLIITTKMELKKYMMVGYKLLIKSGLIKMHSSGIYTYLYLAWKVIKNIKSIIRCEMNIIGSQEISMPILQSIDIWKKSLRWNEYGNELFKLKDRTNRLFCLSPTHEEFVTLLVKKSVESYKKYPMHLYQIQSKFRDEKRPQSGLIRMKEFIMKDGYSFDIGKKKSLHSYYKIQEVYKHILNIFNIKYRIVLAHAGNIGGSTTHEFCILVNNGDNDFIICKCCKKAYDLKIYEKDAIINIKKKRNFVYYINNMNIQKRKNAFFTKFFITNIILCQINNTYMLIILEYKYILNLNKIKHANHSKNIKILCLNKLFYYLFKIRRSSLYSEIFKEHKVLITMVFDNTLLYRYNLTFCGLYSNYTDIYPIKNLYNKWQKNFININNYIIDCICCICNNNIFIEKGIEIAHTFFLGKKYAKIFNLSIKYQKNLVRFLDMGCYGIGISRLLSITIEKHNDKKGILWPSKIAPFKISIITFNNRVIHKITYQIYNHIKQRSINVLYDTRAHNIIRKLKDHELIGIPMTIIFGKNFATNRKIEIKKNRITIKQILYKENNLNVFIIEIYKYIISLL